jgi:hypothetical protein
MTKSWKVQPNARGAVTGHKVNYVLLISTVAVIVLFVVAYLVTKG